MGRYIDENKMIEAWQKETMYSTDYYDAFDWALESVPTEDVVKVVRCNNCKFYNPFKVVEDFDGLCSINCIEVDKEFYCQYGKEKNNF